MSAAKFLFHGPEAHLRSLRAVAPPGTRPQFPRKLHSLGIGQKDSSHGESVEKRSQRDLRDWQQAHEIPPKAATISLTGNMRNPFRPIPVGAHVLVLVVFVLGVVYDSRAVVAAATALVVSVTSIFMTCFYAWFLKATGPTRVRVPTGTRFWIVLAVAMGCASMGAFWLIPDATVSGFFAGLALHGVQSSTPRPSPAVMARH